MNVYDTANRLAYEIKNSQEYITYKKLKEEVKNNPELKQKLEEFEKERYEIQIAAVTKGTRDSDKEANMQKLYMQLIENDIMKKYFDAELKFNVTLGDVNKIISEAVEDVIK